MRPTTLAMGVFGQDGDKARSSRSSPGASHLASMCISDTYRGHTHTPPADRARCRDEFLRILGLIRALALSSGVGTGPGSAGRVVLLDSCLERLHTRVSDMTATTVRRRSVSVSPPHTKPLVISLPTGGGLIQRSRLPSCLRTMHRDGVRVNLPRFLQNSRAHRRTSSTTHRLPTSSTRSPMVVHSSLRHANPDLLLAHAPCSAPEPLHGELAISSSNRQCWAVHSGRTFMFCEEDV